MAVAVSITSSREESDEFFWMPIDAGAFCIDVTFDRASKVFYDAIQAHAIVIKGWRTGRT